MRWYLICLNILTFFLYLLDKRFAIKKKWRISEYSLLVLGIFGGGIGALLGMKIWHHKTQKKKFWIINLLSTFLWIFFIIKNNG